jgi:broad specificity phosphatase PhoE
LLAEAIERRTGVQPMREVVLRERDFGAWELRTWDEIYHDHGEEMTKMITDPHHFRPGGGETTDALAARVVQWSQQWAKPGIAVVVTHGGPIAALLGRQRSLPVDDWPSLIPACGEQVRYDPQNAGPWMNLASDAPFVSAAQETADAANDCPPARRSRV